MVITGIGQFNCTEVVNIFCITVYLIARNARRFCNVITVFKIAEIVGIRGIAVYRLADQPSHKLCRAGNVSGVVDVLNISGYHIGYETADLPRT